MTAIVYLIRHAAHGHLGRVLSGRTEGVPLSIEGQAQAAALAAALAPHHLAAIYSSPVLRARSTAEALAVGREIDPVVAPALDEVDFGDWTGLAFDALAPDPAWQHWNRARGTARAPGGEAMAEVQARAGAFAARVAREHAGEAVALVSHCDVIRAMLAGYLGLALDRTLCFDVDPVSVSRVRVGDWGAHVLSINEELAISKVSA